MATTAPKKRKAARQYQDNRIRAKWVTGAVEAFAQETHKRAYEKVHRDDQPFLLAELICNIGHFCDREGIDFQDVLAIGTGNYDHETSPKYEDGEVVDV